MPSEITPPKSPNRFSLCVILFALCFVVTSVGERAAAEQRPCAHSTSGFGKIGEIFSWLTGNKSSAAAPPAPASVTAKLPPPTWNGSYGTLQKIVGACTIPRTLPACRLPTRQLPDSINVYDGLVRRGEIQAQRAFLPNLSSVKVTMENGVSRPMTEDDFIAIDLLARTIFSEMRGSICLKKSYQLAVARTIINRARSGKESFISSRVRGNNLVRVMLKNKQFSAWNNDDEVVSRKTAMRPRDCSKEAINTTLNKHLTNTRWAICPKAPDATEETKAAWQKSVVIAMEAVVNEPAFLKRTNSLADVEYYTSGIPPKETLVHVPAPILDGERLDDRKCLRFWKDPPKVRK